MGINVNWSDPSSVGGAASLAGQGAFKLRQRDRDREDLRFLLGLEQQERQFDDQMAMRAREQDLQSQRFYDAQALDAQQRSDYLAAQQYGAAMQDQNILDRDAQNFQQQQALYGQQLDARGAAQGAATLDQQAAESLKQFRGMNLSPEGQRKLSELSGALNAIQSARGVSLRDPQYNEAMGQWFSQVESNDLSQYEVKQPTAQEQFQQGLVPMQGQQVFPGQPLPPGKYKYINGMRNGAPTWEDYEVQPEAPNMSAQEKYESRRAQTSWGSEIYFDDAGKPHEFTPPKQEKAQEEGAAPRLTAKEQMDLNKMVHSQLLDEWKAEQAAIPTDIATGKPSRKIEPFSEYYKNNRARVIEDFNSGFGDPETETLTPSDEAPAYAPSPNAPSTMAGPDFAGLPVGGFEDGVYRPGEDGPPQYESLPGDPSPPTEAESLDGEPLPEDLPEDYGVSDGAQIIGPNPLGEYALVDATGEVVRILSAEEAAQLQQGQQ